MLCKRRDRLIGKGADGQVQGNKNAVIRLRRRGCRDALDVCESANMGDDRLDAERYSMNLT